MNRVNQAFASLFDEYNTALKKRKLSFDRILAAIAAALMLSYVYQLLRNGSFQELQGYFNSINMAVFILIAVLACAVLIAVTVLLRQSYVIPWALMAFTAAVSMPSSFASASSKKACASSVLPKSSP